MKLRRVSATGAIIAMLTLTGAVSASAGVYEDRSPEADESPCVADMVGNNCLQFIASPGDDLLEAALEYGLDYESPERIDGFIASLPADVQAKAVDTLDELEQKKKMSDPGEPLSMLGGSGDLTPSPMRLGDDDNPNPTTGRVYEPFVIGYYTSTGAVTYATGEFDLTNDGTFYPEMSVYGDVTSSEPFTLPEFSCVTKHVIDYWFDTVMHNWSDACQPRNTPTSNHAVWAENWYQDGQHLQVYYTFYDWKMEFGGGAHSWNSAFKGPDYTVSCGESGTCRASFVS